MDKLKNIKNIKNPMKNVKISIISGRPQAENETTVESATTPKIELPATGKTLLLNQFIDSFADLDADQIQGHFEWKDEPLPQIQPDEVLIRVERSPINPADVLTLNGTYGDIRSQKLPIRVGFEGSGTIVAAGKGMISWANGLLPGKRVGFMCGGGAWGEYVAVKNTACTPLPDDIDFDQGASAFVNPLTVIAFIEVAKSMKQTTIVHTAGASSLGKMLIRLGKKEGISVIAVVRKAEQVQSLMELGAIHVVNTSDDEWEEDLKAQTARYSSTLAFDAVGGELTGKILHVMPKGSVVKVYGALSEEACTVSPGDLIFAKKKVEGFWLRDYIAERKWMVGLALWQRKQKSLLSNELKTTVKEVVETERIGYAVRSYLDNMTAGKILLNPKSEELEKEEHREVTSEDEVVLGSTVDANQEEEEDIALDGTDSS